MPSWLRVIRGMVGTGLTFAAGIGVIGSLIGLIGVLAGELSAGELLAIVARTSVVAFIVGVAFSAVLATSARGLPFQKLSLRLVTSLGAAVGLLYFLLIAISGLKVWSVTDAIANLAILLLLGAGSAAGTLILARRAGRTLKSGEESGSQSEERIEQPLPRGETPKEE